MHMYLHCLVPENIMTPPWKVLWFEAPTPWNFQFSLILSLKKLAFETSLPLKISNDHLGMGMDIFWNHTLQTFANKITLGLSYI